MDSPPAGLPLQHADVAFAPDRLAADAHPAGGAEPGEEFGEMAGVFRLAGEAADGVDLPGAAAPAFDLLPGEIAAAQLDARGALAKALEIDVQGAGAIERAQGANAVAKPREDDGKLGTFGQAAGALELGGRLEADGHNVDGGWFRVEAGHDWRGAGFPDGLGDACHVELFRAFQFGAPASGTETFFGQAAERGTEVHQSGLVQVEDMRVEVEAIAGRHGEAVQVGHAKDEGAGPVGQAAGGRAEGTSGLEEAGVDVRGHGIAQHRAKSAAHHVGALAARKMHLIQRAEMEAESVELECRHNVASGRNWLLLYNGKAFDSCFPLRTEFERGLRESIPAAPFLLSGAAFCRSGGSVRISTTLRRNIGR